MKNLLKKIWPVILILGLWFIFAFPYFFKNVTILPSNYLVNFFSPWNAYQGFAGPVKNGAMPDILTQIVPWKIFTIDTLKSGQIPLWNPYTFSGTTHLANYQSSVLTPFNLLFFILPFITAWNLLVLLQPLLAGIFMFFYARTLKFSNLAALISSISFMFCGFIVTWMAYGTLGYAILYLPLALFAIEKYYSTEKLRYLLLLSVTLPLSFFSGHFQISIYFAGIVFTYLIFKSLISKNKKNLFITLLYFAIGLLFTLPQVFPSIEAYMQSLRSTIFNKIETIPWGYWATVLAPDFYGNPVTRNDWFGHYAEWNAYLGLVPLMLGVYALGLIKKNKHVAYFFGVSIIAILFSFQSPIIDMLVFLKIPVISTSAASRVIILFSFSFAFLAGSGFDKLLNDFKEKKLKTIFGVPLLFGVLFIILWITVLGKMFLPLDKIIVARQNLILPTIFFISTFVVIALSVLLNNFKHGIFVKIAMFLLVLLVAFDMYRFAVKWMPKDPQKFVYPNIPVSNELSKLSGVDRVVSNLGGEATIYYKLPSLEGYDAVYNQRYGEFMAALDKGNLEESARSVVAFPKNGLYSKQGMDLLGVKYVLHKFSDDHAGWTFPYWNYPNSFSLIYDDGVYQIFNNKDAFPRVFLANKYIVRKDPQQILLTMFTLGNNLKNEVVLEENPNIKLDGSGSVNIKNYTANKIFIEANSNGNTMLFISDSYNSGWKAFVDGKEAKIYRADFSFKSIVLPKGKHMVEFIFMPLSFYLGLIGAGIGLIIMLMDIFLRRAILKTKI
jgi:hypothetical protein